MRSVHNYRLYGIAVRSEISLTFPEQATGEPDVSLRLESAEWFHQRVDRTSPGIEGSRWYQRILCPDGAEYLRWPDLFEFLVSSDGRAVHCRALDRADSESFQTYLLSQVLSCALIKQGLEPLHATAVVIGGAAVALLGASGQGKSTLAAALVGAGGRVLTDDLLIVRQLGGVMCGFPGPPRIKLFPQAARRFLPNEAALAPMNPQTDKYIVALPPSHVHNSPAPMHAFYVIDGIEGLDEQNLEVTTVTGVSAYVELLTASFNKRLVGPERLRRQFSTAREWTARIPVKRVRYAWRLDALDGVVRAIVADVNHARESVM